MKITTQTASHAQWVVDGHTHDNPDSDLQGDGQFAPFWVFDPEGQRYVAGPFDKREDAALIASAPDMLKALKECREALKWARSHVVEPAVYDETGEVNARMLDIIARAEGRA